MAIRRPALPPLPMSDCPRSVSDVLVPRRLTAPPRSVA
jgi:hypothetical protein